MLHHFCCQFQNLIEDPEKFGDELVACIKEETKDWAESQEDGLMGMINKIVNATREFPNKLNEIREQIEEFKVGRK